MVVLIIIIIGIVCGIILSFILGDEYPGTSEYAMSYCIIAFISAFISALCLTDNDSETMSKFFSYMCAFIASCLLSHYLRDIIFDENVMLKQSDGFVITAISILFAGSYIFFVL